MEDVYTIKVKTKPDTRNLYPSERRYSASTVSGLAWVHIALAATSFLLACLALFNPHTEISRNLQDSDQGVGNMFNITGQEELTIEVDETTKANVSDDTNSTEQEVQDEENRDINYLIVIAPILITVFALAAGVASILASTRWYIDRNITLLFVISVLSTVGALISFIMVITWIVKTQVNLHEFYRDKIPFEDVFVIKHTDVIDKNESHISIRNTHKDGTANVYSIKVLSINILIASFLELLWSILSVKISYKGMRNTDEDDNKKRGNCLTVITTVKGNRTKNNIATKPDLLVHYPNSKIKKIFLAQNDAGFYLKKQDRTKDTETSSELYKERMTSFLNRCALEGNTNPETQSVHSELSPIAEVIDVEINQPDSRMTVSWGDTPDHTIYNQNTLNLERIFNFERQMALEANEIDD